MYQYSLELIKTIIFHRVSTYRSTNKLYNIGYSILVD